MLGKLLIALDGEIKTALDRFSVIGPLVFKIYVLNEWDIENDRDRLAARRRDSRLDLTAFIVSHTADRVVCPERQHRFNAALGAYHLNVRFVEDLEIKIVQLRDAVPEVRPGFISVA
ncbi:hypothetical protein [Hyphomicrobium sp. 99]|uniref:hypothetical protein n=1 Tax=Hyphomicrobium sp. 99 TaxID=1163419 RepID=UPI0012E069A1|nr:hypothetical protein [Hyphomicrobium sp. 99]